MTWADYLERSRQHPTTQVGEAMTALYEAFSACADDIKAPPHAIMGTTCAIAAEFCIANVGWDERSQDEFIMNWVDGIVRILKAKRSSEQSA